MKAKNCHKHHRTINRAETLPHEMGTHLFALIKRNLLARRQTTTTPAPNQLTFAF